MKTESREHVTSTSAADERPAKKPGCLKKISNAIIVTLEKGFYKLGLAIARRPLIVIACCVLACGLVGVGFLRFKETTDPDELWVPLGANIVKEGDWVSQNFPSTTRASTIIITSSNVLTATALKSAYNMYESVVNSSLENVCLKIGPNCRVSSVLELWSYDKTTVSGLSDNAAILNTVNTQTTSPIYGGSYDVTTMLGMRSGNATGYITSAEAMLMTFLLLGDGAMEEAAKALELKIIEIGKAGHSALGETYVFTTRSFSDEGGGAIQGDVGLLSAGYFILIVFVILVLGRFNLVEQRIGLAFGGILCIGLSILVSFGLASLCGAEYGPLHSVLPFLLLGIGVDDMFIVVGALNNLTPEARQMDIPEKVGRVLKSAGVSVTVTSLTDMVAFSIGASTILPALRSFCAFAAFGILGVFVLQTVFFTACLTLDLRRQDAMRDACICCYKHKHWHPNKCSQRELIPLFFRKILGPVLAKLPVKIVVIVVTLGLFGANVYGVTQLKQDFDSSWFLPSDSYAYKFIQAQEKYFPDDGADGYIYCRNIDYFNNRAKLDQLYNALRTHQYTYNGTVSSWYEDYKQYIVSSGSPNATDETSFIQSVFDYAHTPAHARVLANIKFSNNSGTASDITATRMGFQHVNFADAQAEVRGMDAMRDVVSGILPECFPYSRRYRSWETNKVIQQELYRNIGLAFGCVFIVTLILIADIFTSILVFTCVAFTLVNVGGCMYFWGLTIDTVTSIILIIAIGLAVDYSAHIGHQFMTIKGNRQERMIETVAEMGPPVFNGGFSTLLAFILLAGSNSYVFTTFFKVFLLVVCYGLFHGLIYLPVILSWLGPSPYMSADHEYHQKEVEVDPATRFGRPYENSTRIGAPPPEPPPDYDIYELPANGVAPNGVGMRNGSPSKMQNGYGHSKHTRTSPPIPAPDYTPPRSPRRTVPIVST